MFMKMPCSLLKWILEGIDSSQLGNAEPNGDISEGEEVIGEITDPDLKKLWIFLNSYLAGYEKEKKSLLGKLATILDSEEKKEECGPGGCLVCQTMADLELREDLLKVLDTLFWISVKMSLSPEKFIAFSQKIEGSLRIVKGWKIVSLPPKKVSVSISFI